MIAESAKTLTICSDETMAQRWHILETLHILQCDTNPMTFVSVDKKLFQLFRFVVLLTEH